jgi:hypothetical protein
MPLLRSSSIALRLGLCAAALVGSVAANATVVTFSTPISVPNNFDGIYLNLATGTFASSGGASAGWDFNPYNSGVSLSFFWSATPSQASGVASTTTGPYSDLTPGTTISGGSTFAQVTATAATAAFQTAGTHTLGFRFYNEGTASINYGYMSLTSGGATGFPLTINSWSFENSGGSITIPAIPEASTTLMMSFGALALGAVNLRRLRRQRRLAS